MLRQQFSTWASNAAGTVPSGAAPICPEMWSQRAFGGASIAWV